MMRYLIDTNELIDYDKFLAIKRMPQYSFVGNTAVFPDEYAALLGVGAPEKTPFCYDPLDGLFDYQRDITAAAIRKRKFAVFADCGLGKTLIFLEFARHALAESGGIILIVSPLMVIPQTIRETSRFYDDTLHIERVSAANLAERLRSDQSGIVITNYEAITEGLSADHLSGLILDESSM
ncbi:MAG: DEAD/DEAH box helicase family protein, partial [Nitrospiraceae bacterium]|nr:DEAD/DEAH box helicase family protein [Nitrospiraceae bacterium]